MNEYLIKVFEEESAPIDGCIPLVLGRNLRFSTAGIDRCVFARREALVSDAMIVAAAIEFADRSIERPSKKWGRNLSLCIPVHDPDRWNSKEVNQALVDAVGFLTGDQWEFNFARRAIDEALTGQDHLDLEFETDAVMPYSDGLDSLAVAAIIGDDLGDRLVRVRVGSKRIDLATSGTKSMPLSAVPYELRPAVPFREPSGRSRGFKFLFICSIAAYLANSKRVIIPESGQGALGPALEKVSQTYSDYRNSPRFTTKLRRLVISLFGRELDFEFPRIWFTKGQTLREFFELTESPSWASTVSCWRSSRWCSVDRKKRQCGVCAACMLRRLSVHAAGLDEPPDAYIACKLDAPTWEEAVNPRFKKLNRSFQEYGVAGVLHLDHLAGISEGSSPSVETEAALLGLALGISKGEAVRKIGNLLVRHATEWKSYVSSLGNNSVVGKLSRFQYESVC